MLKLYFYCTISVRPYLAETYFIMYRLTGDKKYQDWAWELTQAIYQHCETPSGGYSGLSDVNSVPALWNNFQRPNFISGTLKFLYLIFADHSSFPLERWIFNSQGHPLPVCGFSDQYTAKMCKL